MQDYMATIRVFEQAAHAQLYSKFRPIYPQKILDIISGFISRNGGGFGVAVDVACGSGQSTFYLSSRFQNCFGFDISEAQVECAQQKHRELNVRNVSFKVANAASLPLENASVDLVSCAQAWHWMDPDQLYHEADRVLKPKGCLAVYGYGNCRLLNQECNRLVSHFYSSTLKGFWNDRRRHIDQLYQEVSLPYQNSERHDLDSGISSSMKLPHFIGYVSSWSGYQNYCDRNPGNSVLEDLQQNMEGVLKEDDSGCKTQVSSGSDSSSLVVDVVFPVFLILGQK